MEIGCKIGRYVIRERLGAGGMGEVYRARDERLERDVAFKVVSATPIPSEQAQKQLRKEALALSRLNHPNIAAVYDFDIADGVAFVAMELVPGTDLRDRLSTGPLAEKDLLNVAVQAADALQAAHSAGVIHRDLKPANLRVTPEGRLKVLDFGLAVHIAKRDEISVFATETATSAIAGTIPYMAPEQLRGEPADPRSDVHALCAVLYELATGARPFDARPDAVLIDQILNEAPASPRALNPRVSLGLEALILKGLEKDPARRYQTTRELAVDLERLRTPATATVRAASSRDSRAPRGWTPRRRAAVVATAVVVSLAGLVGWLLWRGPLSNPLLSFAPRDWILVADFDNQTGEAVFDTSLGTAFAIGLGQSRHANVVSRARVDEALTRMGRKSGARIDQALAREICVREGVRGLIAPGISQVGRQYALTATLVEPQSGAAVRSYVERADTADEILDALGRIGDAVRGDLGESLAAIRQDSRPLPQVTTASLTALQSFADGQVLWRKGQYSEAIGQYQRAVEIDPEFAMAHSALGGAYLSFVSNQPARGRTHLERALALADRVTERERAFLQATYESTLGNRVRAIDLYRAYLFRYPDDYTVRFNFAGLLRELRRFEEAAAEYEQVIASSPAHASALINLATVHKQTGRIQDALVAYDKAFGLEPTWKRGGNLNHEYGFTLVQAARVAEARDVFGLALASQEERPRGLRSLALLEMYGGKYREAETRLSEAVRLNQSLKRPLSAGRDLLYLAVVAEGRGDRRRHREYLGRGVAELEQVAGLGFLARAGVSYARDGLLSEAERLARVTARLLKEGDPTLDHEVKRLEGEILVARGQHAAGIELLKTADLQPGSVRQLTKESLAYAYERAGDVDLAISAYEEFLGTDTLGFEAQHAWLDAHNRLARLLVERGEPDKARARLNALLALWNDADPDLPLLQAVRTLLAQLQAR